MTTWMRRLAPVIVFAYVAGSAPAVFAEGPLTAAARRAAAGLAAETVVGTAAARVAAQAPAPGASRGGPVRLAPAGGRAAAAQGADDVASGMSGRTKLWIGIGVGVALAAVMWAVDRNVEDRTTSSLGQRLDGCGFGC